MICTSVLWCGNTLFINSYFNLAHKPWSLRKAMRKLQSVVWRPWPHLSHKIKLLGKNFYHLTLLHILSCCVIRTSLGTSTCVFNTATGHTYVTVVPFGAHTQFTHMFTALVFHIWHAIGRSSSYLCHKLPDLFIFFVIWIVKRIFFWCNVVHFYIFTKRKDKMIVLHSSTDNQQWGTNCGCCSKVPITYKVPARGFVNWYVLRECLFY